MSIARGRSCTADRVASSVHAKVPSHAVQVDDTASTSLPDRSHRDILVFRADRSPVRESFEDVQQGIEPSRKSSSVVVQQIDRLASDVLERRILSQ